MQVFSEPSDEEVHRVLHKLADGTSLNNHEMNVLRYHRLNEVNPDYMRKFKITESWQANSGGNHPFEAPMIMRLPDQYVSHSPINRCGGRIEQQQRPQQQDSLPEYSQYLDQQREQRQSLPEITNRPIHIEQQQQHLLWDIAPYAHEPRSLHIQHDQYQMDPPSSQYHFGYSLDSSNPHAGNQQLQQFIDESALDFDLGDLSPLFRNFVGHQTRALTPINDDVFADFDSSDWNPNAALPTNDDPIASSTCQSIPTENLPSQVPPDEEKKQLFMGLLKNIDNSCYMNSVLYILRMTPKFVHNLHHLLENLQYIFDEFDPEVARSSSPNDCLQSIATSLMVSNFRKWPDTVDGVSVNQRRLFAEMHLIFAKMTEMEFYNVFYGYDKAEFQRIVHEINHTFTPGTQEDAHELLATIMHLIHECGDALMKVVAENANMFDK